MVELRAGVPESLERLSQSRLLPEHLHIVLVPGDVVRVLERILSARWMISLSLRGQKAFTASKTSSCNQLLVTSWPMHCSNCPHRNFFWVNVLDCGVALDHGLGRMLHGAFYEECPRALESADG